MNYSRVLFSSRTICSDPSETKSVQFFLTIEQTTFQVVTRDDFDVDVLGDGGEGYLEAADGGGVPWLDLGKPASTAR